MERRSCINLHFINAIKGNSVSKLSNVNSRGKPALVFKKLEDILTIEDQRIPSYGFQHSGSKFSSLPLVDRTLREIDIARTEAVCSGGDDEMGSDSDDYTFGNMTLKQLKERRKTKKRIRANSAGLNPLNGYVKLEPEEDDADLNETLYSLKLKLPKSKRKCKSNASTTPKLAVSIKPEQGLDYESPALIHGDLASLNHVKEEVTVPEFEGCQAIVSSDDDSFTINQNDGSSIAQGISDGFPKTAECQSLEPSQYGEQYHSCSLNQVSYDHLEDVEPLPPILPSSQDLMDVNNEEKRSKQREYGRENQIEQPLEINSTSKDQSSDLNGYLSSYHLQEFSGKSSNNPIIQVPDNVVDDSRKELYYGGDFHLFQDTLDKQLATNRHILSSDEPAKTSSRSWSFHPCSDTEDELHPSEDDNTEATKPSKCITINRLENNLNVGNNLDLLEDESSLNKEKQPLTSTRTDTERDSSSRDKSCAFEETHSSSLLVQSPERLLTTRKVISPTSEEQLCLSIDSIKAYDDMDCQDCEESLCNVKQTENKTSYVESEKHVNIPKSPKESAAVSRTKFILSPSQIQRKPKHVKISPPKGNFEGPRLSRSLPSVSTGCTSVKGCSESAIAFSRRQMHDIESLATKLVSELKSMKDIVEEKLLFEAYRSVSLRNDAEEVKNAITNATKAEEMARKWLSMMGRDCNRFCKIMSLTQKGSTGSASSNVVQRGKKRITFADEAGGMLCHVKFFENGMTSFDSNSVNQERSN